MERRYIMLGIASVSALGALLLIPFNNVWDRTPLPAYVGELVYELDTAREQAAFTASLLAQPAAATIAIPVIGVETDDVTDTYGAARGSTRLHEGTDIFAPRGTYILSATDGVVVRIGTNRLGGNIVFVLGPGGERYYYAHLDEIEPTLSIGQRVSTSTILGRVGTTGNATGTPPHLHFGIYGDGGARNPYERLNQ